MHQVVCATTNPAKIQAILQAFHEIFGEGSCHIASVAVESGVPEQPFGSEETRAGARNRVANARRLHPEADFWVAIEAGIDGDSTFSWVVIENASQRGEARSATLPLPAYFFVLLFFNKTFSMNFPGICHYHKGFRINFIYFFFKHYDLFFIYHAEKHQFILS